MCGDFALPGRVKISPEACGRCGWTRSVSRPRRSIRRVPQPGERPSGVTDDVLRAAVPRARHLSELLRDVGLVACGGNYESMRRRLLALGLLEDRFCSQPGRRSRDPEVTDEALLAAFATSSTRADLLRAVGLPVDSRSYSWLKRRLTALGPRYAELNGQGWARGRRAGPKRPLSDLLVAGAWVGSHLLRVRLLAEEVLDHRCSECRLTHWRGQPVPLELDHVSGDRYDNRLENLRLLCPNCHAQTPTYRGRNIGRGRRPGAG